MRASAAPVGDEERPLPSRRLALRPRYLVDVLQLIDISAGAFLLLIPEKPDQVWMGAVDQTYLQVRKEIKAIIVAMEMLIAWSLQWERGSLLSAWMEIDGKLCLCCRFNRNCLHAIKVHWMKFLDAFGVA
ncbi:hypothetical protein EJB05_25023, partial [Eragrostis curvula]